MNKVRSSRWRIQVGLIALVFLWNAVTALPLSAAVTNGPVRRVLVLHSFGREFAPFSILSGTFRTELARQSAFPVEFYEASIEMARFSEGMNEQPVADYLQALFKDRRLDLIVAMGGPATLFVNRHREQLFPEVPVVATMDQRRVNVSGASTNMTVVTLQLNLPGLIEDILQVRPATTNVIVVFGVSPFERYWAAECEREFAGFTNRVAFTRWSGLSLEAMTKRAASLPPNSAIWYGAMVMDAASVPHEQDTAIVALHDAANAPIFGVFEHQLGMGIVGGRLASNEAWGRRTAEAALRILNGEPPGQIQSEPTGPEMPAYDWRELRRWNISEKSLPPGSIVRFRTPTVWEEHKYYVIGGLAIFVAQALTITLLLLQARARNKAQRALAESEERMALAAEAANLGIWTRDLVRDEIWMSNKWREVFGFGISEHLEWHDVLHRLHPGDRQIITQAIANAVAGGGHYNAEFRIMLPDQQVRWISSRGRVEFGRAGEPVRIRGVSADITRRKQEQEKFRLVVEASPAGIVLTDSAGRIVLVNSTVEKLFGYARDELIGQAVELLMPERFRGAHPGHRSGFMAAPQARVMGVGRELFARRKDGKEIPVEIGLSPIQSVEGILVLTVIVDISARKQSEVEIAEHRRELAHLSRIATVNELSGSLAHELNQPLGIILSNAQAGQRLLAQEPPDLAEVRDILADIVSEDQRASEVIKRLRSMLKPGETGLQPLDMNATIEDVLRLVSSDLIGQNVTVQRKLAASLPPILGDAIQLQQVLLNLVLNACDAMAASPPARRRLTLATAQLDNVVRVFVSDTGSGLPPDVERVFKPFYTTKQKGLGLGLAICRSIVTAHKGRLWAEANVVAGIPSAGTAASCGATFHLELPAETGTSGKGRGASGGQEQPELHTPPATGY